MSRPLDLNRPLIPLDTAKLEASLRTHVSAGDFPCVGAKSALAKGTLFIEPAWSLVSAWDDVRIHQRLMEWSSDYARTPEGLRSFAVVFSEPSRCRAGSGLVTQHEASRPPFLR